MSRAPLRSIVLAATGQDVRRCSHCALCSESPAPGQDVSLETLVQMVVMNDEEVLTCRTLWEAEVFANARHACPNGVNLEAVLLALRHEAWHRGVAPSRPPGRTALQPGLASGGGEEDYSIE